MPKWKLRSTTKRKNDEKAKAGPSWGKYRLNELTFGVLDSRVLGADMRCELLVALLFVLTSHFVYRVADGRPCHVENPCAFRATPAPKILSFDPYQFTAYPLHSAPPNLVWLCFCEGRRSIGVHRDEKGRFSLPSARFGASHHA